MVLPEVVAVELLLLELAQAILVEPEVVVEAMQEVAVVPDMGLLVMEAFHTVIQSVAQNGGEYLSGNGASNGTGGGGGGGGTYGSAELNRLYLGSGAGCGGRHDGYTPGFGGNGGGILIISTNILTNDGIISSNGNNGGNYSGYYTGGGGAGAGGSIILNGLEIDITSSVSATGGTGGTGYYGNPGGAGGNGRIRINYDSLSNSGTIDPIAFEAQFEFGVYHSTLMNTSNETVPYLVEAYYFDTVAVSSASLYYSINSGAYVQLAMTITGDTLTANIPAQVYATVIDYYISATNGTDIYFSPENAPTEFHSFSIDVFAPRHLSITDNLNGNIDLNWIEPVDLNNFSDYSIYRSEIFGFIPDSISLLANNFSDTFYTDNTVADFHKYHYKVAANYSMTSGNEFDYSEDSVYVNIDSITTIKGYAFLEGQTNHAGIKVKFHPISPSAVLDSVNTDALGYFEIHINPGTYDITYEKTNYQTYYIKENYSIIEDLDLEESTILYLGNVVSGAVSGVWNGIYSVVGDIYINNGDSLIIEEGSEIRFQNNYQFDINGYLAVDGISSNKVLFTSAPYHQIHNWGQWLGLDFNDVCDDNSYMNFAIVEYANHNIYTYAASPDFSNCEFRHASGNILYIEYYSHPTISNCLVWDGNDHGIYIYNYSNPNLNNIEIYDCIDYGIYIYNYSNPNLENIDVHDNTSYGIRIYNYCYNAKIIDSKIYSNGNDGLYIDYNYESSIDILNCEIYENGDDGVYIYDSDVNFEFCKIYKNIAQGFEINDYCDPVEIYDCEIYENNSYGIYSDYDNDVYVYRSFVHNNNGTGIYIEDDYTYYKIYKSIIAYNNGDGIYKRDPNMTIYIHYNTIYGNTADGIDMNNSTYEYIYDNIIVNNGQYGLRANTYIETFEYNNLFGNGSGEIYNLANVPINSWTFVSYNANGDDADIYLNISEEPYFVLTDSLDFQLQAISSCINVGDPTMLDPDGTVSDLGALYRDAGNPHAVNAVGYDDQEVSLNWETISLDSVLSYNVYYKIDTVLTYTYFNNTTDTFIDVTGLTNNALYDFTVTGVFANYESIYAPKASERPGIPDIILNPIAMNVTIPSAVDTLVENLQIINPGSRDLNIDFDFLNIPAGAAQFDGSGDYINIGDHSNYHNLSAITVECWVKKNNTGHTEIVSKSNNKFSIYIDDTQFGFYKNGSSYGSGYNMPNSEWHHLAVTWTGSNIIFYVNGIKQNEHTGVSSSTITSGYNLQLGRRGDYGAYYLNGNIIEVKIWNIARTQQEIISTMTSSLNGNESGLIGYWPLHENYNDYSTYGRNGSPSGNTYINSSSSILSENVSLLFRIPQNHYNISSGDTIQVPFSFPNYNTESIFTILPIFTDILTNSQIDYEILINYGENVPSSPVHFISVAANDFPYTLIITDAQLDGSTISIGDEIAVFDGSLCVGSGIFDGTFNFTLTCYEDTSGAGTAGFTDGNSMIFKIYDTSADLDATEVNAAYDIGDGTFGYGEFSALSLDGTVYQIQEVPVSGGMFSLISFNLLPRYPASSTIFGDLSTLGIVYTDAGAAMIPLYGINSIGDINFRDGFHLFSSDPDTIHFEGTLINPLEWNITVEANKWNSIAFLGQGALDITSAFPSEMVDSIDIVQTSTGQMWSPAYGINSIGNMLPGVGYQIALNSYTDYVFSYQTGGAISQSKSQTIEPEHFNFVKTGLPYSIIIENPKIEGEQLQIGDEIAVFDGNLCVGAVVYDGSERISLTAWERENTFNLPGFTKNNEIQIRIYSVQNNIEIEAEIIPMNERENNIIFKGENFSYISVDANEQIILNSSVQVYPNPFKTITQFNYFVSSESFVSIEIYDIAGTKVKTLISQKQEKGRYSIIWDGTNDSNNKLPNGYYLFEFNTFDTSQVNKLLLMK
ncbi:MAG: T9SS type A sorting domain-containing protein [Bacteroidetes bacterium]|nr:T9SS type A sorting domain-containing protein [Bacteroidota bacterium]